MQQQEFKRQVLTRQKSFNLKYQNLKDILEQEIIFSYLKSEEELSKFLESDSSVQRQYNELTFREHNRGPNYMLRAFSDQPSGDIKIVPDPDNELELIEPESAMLRSARKIQYSYKAYQKNFEAFKEEISPLLNDPSDAESIFKKLTELQKQDQEEGKEVFKKHGFKHAQSEVIKKEEVDNPQRSFTFADLVKKQIARDNKSEKIYSK